MGSDVCFLMSCHVIQARCKQNITPVSPSQIREAEGRRAEEQLAQTAPEVCPQVFFFYFFCIRLLCLFDILFVHNSFLFDSFSQNC